MAQFDLFRKEVESAIYRLNANDALPDERTIRLLDGAASNALNVHFSSEDRAKDGIFFSGHALSSFVASFIKDKIQSGATIADPTCGAGDLLLGCMEFSPIENDLTTTLEKWDKQVFGLDIHEEFSATTRARLLLLAATKYRRNNPSSSQDVPVGNFFSNVRHADYFREMQHVANVDCVVMNPPFYNVNEPVPCSYGTGCLQIAARFFQQVVEQGNAGQEIVAVLPDVLRSGTRYARWRSQIEQRAEILNLCVYGKFDKRTDVDVFVIHVRKKDEFFSLDTQATADWNLATAPIHPISTEVSLNNFFEVTVGSVVPHRHNNRGKWFKYLSVASAPPHGVAKVDKRIRTTGTVHQAPFVAIRRTSSPSDTKRIVATLVTGKEKFAVENHLIVIQPRDNTSATCKRLLNVLAQDQVNNWINQAIRCRHLTTKVMKLLPLGGWEK